MKCPCNPKKVYTDCCKKAHTNIKSITTAEQLMRSRYSAFVLADIEYLQKSHYSKTRPSKRDKKEILQWMKSVSWHKLEVVKTNKGGIDDVEGTVEFKAFFIENGKIEIIHENSNFCRENKHWVYVDGVHN